MFDDCAMRTTMELDDDLLVAAKELASARGRTAGQMISELLRKALTAPLSEARVRNGVPLLPRRSATAPVPTMALVNQLRDE
jgi:hypothetical protein